MKKVSFVIALVLGFAVTSFAQLGQAKCAWGQEQAHGEHPVVLFTNIGTHGILDSEGEPAYSVSLRADYTTNTATNVYLIENKTGKKWWMNQVTPVGNTLPGLCSGNQGADLSNARVYRSPMTKLVVYVSVRAENNKFVYVFVHKPADAVLTL
ncbi:hypothetical protein IC229_34745 [Spirosoma sp. BT702]|uniref:Uncharacterized protein n=1 Tax=Spirosoma profusum TaxID=2771354 RepID=A0A927AWP1_9BACT|nr:hypothetical protein [Spirosoma profusum]MBD2705810.1 hypothetical protein [Spirosoma profusum]